MEIINKDFLENILDTALKYGAKEAEVYSYDGKISLIPIVSGELKQPSFSRETGIGVRVVIDDKIGFSSTNSLTKDKINETVKRAISIAKASKPIENWGGLPAEEKYPTVKNIRDKRIEGLSGDEILDMAKTMVTASTETDKRVIPVWGGVTVGAFKEAIANTNNLFGEKEGTIIGGVLGVIARDGNITTPVHNEQGQSRMLDVNFEEIGKKAAESAIQSLKIAKIETGDYPAIISPEPFSMISLFTLYNAIDGDWVRIGRSPYKNKVGEQVASDNFTLIDDGTLPNGSVSAPFDDEGVPMQKKVLIENGVLNRFIYDHHKASIIGVKSTGNALRGGFFMSGQTTPKYETLPSIFPTNVIILQGDQKLEDMINDMEKGILVLGVQGAHSSNPETGEVSVVATPAWLIENGEIKGNVPGVMLNTNIYDALRKIVALSKETERVYNQIGPWIEFEKMKFISK